MVEPEPAPFLPDMRRNEPGAAAERDELAAEFLRRPVMAEPGIAFARDHLVADEGFGALAKVDDVLGDRKVHRRFPLQERGRRARITPKKTVGREARAPFPR